MDAFRLAYYGFGNVDDPLGTIHDKSGAPLCSEGEILISSTKDVRCSIIRARGKLLGFLSPDVIFHNTIGGTLYRTDSRFVYIRQPSYKAQIAKSGAGALADAADAALLAKGWERAGKRECFSLPINLVTSVRAAKAGTIIEFCDGERYRVCLFSRNAIQI